MTMTTAEIIKQMEKEFDELFVGEKSYPRKGLYTERIRVFYKDFFRTLLESFGEEVCPEWIDNPYGEVTNYSVGRRDERKAIRLKVKEIIESLDK